MQYITSIAFLLISINLTAQKKVEDFGFRHFSANFSEDTVEFIVRSKTGEELKRKPIFIYIQGSLAKPLIRYKDNGSFRPPYSFASRILEDRFHIICIKKPGIPLISKADHLTENGEFIDPTTGFRPQKFSERNYLEYYVERNKEVVEFLKHLSWVDSSKIVVAGHSQGSSIALNMADKIPEITHLIYSAGGPYFGTIVDQIQQERKLEINEQDSIAQGTLNYWKKVVEDPLNTISEKGNDTYRMWHSFSKPENEIFKRIKIPILVSYGTKDSSAPFNDLFQVESIVNRMKNITFFAYLGREHNYFRVNDNGEIDYEEAEFGWDKVGKDWLRWTNEN